MQTLMDDGLVKAAPDAQSIECRDSSGKLAGGVYGVTIDRVFFGESMFSFCSNSSKLCLKYIMECGMFDMLDCQMTTAHLISLGAIEIDRIQFENLLNQMINT